MVVPDGIMQAERFVAVAPGIAGARVLLDDDGGHAQLPQPRPEPDRALTAADNKHIGLLLEAELLRLLLALFLPGLGAGIDPVKRAERTCEAGLFLVPLQFGRRGQQRPDQAILDPEVAVPARDFGLERNRR